MTRRLIQLFLAAALIGGAASEARAADEIARRGAYTVGASGDLDGLCANHPLNPTKKNFGAVCFPFTPGSSVFVGIHDRWSSFVGGWVIFRDAYGRVIGPPNQFGGQGYAICREARIPTPAHWSQMQVYLSGWVMGGAACLSPVADTASIGVVRATFS